MAHQDNRSFGAITARVALAVALSASFVCCVSFAQTGPEESTADPDRAPRRDLSGTWTPVGGTRVGIQANGVQAMPNDGRPEHELPYTEYGLEVYESHRALEGVDAVLPAEHNDPRNRV